MSSSRSSSGRKREALFVDALKDVSVTVNTGSALGIIGRNGSGKTTLMRLLAGIYVPDSGSVRIAGNIAPLLSLGLGFHPDMSGRENVKMNGLVLGLSPRQIERRMEEIVDFAELSEFIDVPIRMYSSGMYMRLAFSVAISVDPDVLLLDEVLAVGDAAFTTKCFERIKDFRRRGKTIVLVTHAPAMLLEWCDTAIWMHQGSVRLGGDVAQVADAYQRDLDRVLRERRLRHVVALTSENRSARRRRPASACGH